MTGSDRLIVWAFVFTTSDLLHATTEAFVVLGVLFLLWGWVAIVQATAQISKDKEDKADSQKIIRQAIEELKKGR